MKKAVLLAIMFFSSVLLFGNNLPKDSTKTAQNPPVEKKDQRKFPGKKKEQADTVFIKNSSDSLLIIALQDSIAYLNQALAQKTEYMDKELLYADSVIVQLAIRRLSEPFSKSKVNNARKDFRRLHSEKFIEDNRTTIDNFILLLDNYEKYVGSVAEIIIKAQNDSKRINPYSDEKEFVNIYTNEIKDTEYYKNYYSRKNVTSAYLNGIIDEFLDKLSKHGKDKRADFSELIAKLPNK